MDQDRSQELLDQWQESGDPEVLDALLRIEIGVLKGIIRGRGQHLLGRSLGATDAAHEAVLGLLRVRSMPRFDNPRALRGYLWKSAWRLLRQRLQGRGRRPFSLDGTGTQGFQDFLATTGGMGEAEEADRSAALAVAMNLLDPKDRNVLHLVYLKGLDIAEAAELLGVSKAAANMRLVRARRALAEKLAGWAEVVGD